ncbi:hypothetical protein BDE02_01G298000 [Populus trichocarpa]|nr:hypothetical protein BDE02_01G298000 [Populus trichocarpa]
MNSTGSPGDIDSHCRHISFSFSAPFLASDVKKIPNLNPVLNSPSKLLENQNSLLRLGSTPQARATKLN